MNKFSSRLRIKTPSPRAWVGLTLIGVSIAGTVWVVSENSTGTVIILANRFIPAGSVVAESDIVSGRVMTDQPVAITSPSRIIGKRVVRDRAPGEIISQHDLDSTAEPRTVFAVPLGIEPASTIQVGSQVQLWFIATDATKPPLLVAPDARVAQLQQSGFGGGTLLDASIASRDSEALLAALGSDGMIVATAGSDE